MTKLLSFAAPLAAAISFCALDVQAAITELTINDSPSEVFAAIEISPGQAGPQNKQSYYHIGNWEITVENTVGQGGAFSILKVLGQHMVSLDGGSDPNPLTFSWDFTLDLGGQRFKNAQADSKAEIFAHGGVFFDEWYAYIYPMNETFVPADKAQMNVYVLELSGKHPVPEPHQFALMAGLGLLGFGAYRRVRA